MSMSDFIHNQLSDEQRHSLYESILNVIHKYYPSEHGDPAARIDGSSMVQRAVVDAISSFMTNESDYRITE